MSPSAEPTPEVALIDVTEAVLEQLLELALREADADEVTPPLGTAAGWNTDRISWFREFHRAAAAGLDGPARQKSWAIDCGGQLAGSIRLQWKGAEPTDAAGGGVAGGPGLPGGGAGAGGGLAVLTGVWAAADAGSGVTGGGVSVGGVSGGGVSGGGGLAGLTPGGAGSEAPPDAEAGGAGGAGLGSGGSDAAGGTLETGIWLARSFRGRGVGREALRLVKDRATSAGAAVLVADTTAGNVGALALLKSAGAELVAGAASDNATVPVKGRIPLR
ncbi:GNAT family N-acetyltransferase [Arthrobacter sp. NicSoilB8]|uniref:GNAT family N-acetyltransferase n=1 Tax=Arthrobacter sp. NicSoilB8 TaxID=2830998 RepID=UPI001CC3774E|nr:GNAT family N-acetyltransferase [Arthrobacter sp. NicSoilB8]BCW71160.1 hypothetical protein NicSoilB8_22040 [Arthrobacter sp. NicSoilB8]